ncbi:zinc/manganese transport system substrate-binding protein [Modicisalibacter xianhensis]|uniref:Zinc/manganese transport system substrate-binding protein n=1 Tax=Modicisalibacter xianhensis TaxID=442341 RepID=A0A4R8FSI3_9GAMM|nr:zinc ABC transporter substrate-binding protein [Halomonas xianhensis]TDX29561.1 zinc/manganese transport system substrate-binding protein [Halomonas xianhensis]
MRRLLALGLIAGTTGLALPAWADPLRVVTSFSVLTDMVEQVGGEQVEVTSLVGRDSDTHAFSPSPGDARRIAEADLVVFNGLQLEGWMERLIEASSYRGPLVVASRGITPLGGDEAHADDGHVQKGDAHGSHDAEAHGHEDHGHGHDEPSHDHEHEAEGHEGHDHGEMDPHAWLDVTRAQQYVVNIRDGLIEADPGHAETYRRNAAGYLDELAALDEEIHVLMADIPVENRLVVTGHDSFNYFADAYDVRFLSPVGLSTVNEPSAALMARLIDTLEEQQVKALFYENITNPALIEQLAEEAGLPIAGTLYSGALAADGDASTYAGMMRHNATRIHDALAKSAD